jgi:hypothetical protein
MTAGIRAGVSWFMEFAVRLNYHAGAGLHFDAGLLRAQMAAFAKALFGVAEEEIEDVQTVAIFCGAGLVAGLCLLLSGWI